MRILVFIGLFVPLTQAALAQFQLANDIPASGMLDKATLDALGVSAQESSSGG